MHQQWSQAVNVPGKGEYANNTWVFLGDRADRADRGDYGDRGGHGDRGGGAGDRGGFGDRGVFGGGGAGGHLGDRADHRARSYVPRRFFYNE